MPSKSALTASRSAVTMLLVAAMLALSWTVAAVGEAQTSPRTVILDAPGALEALQRSNPAHFHKVQKILDGLLQQQAADVPRWMGVSFGARNVSYGHILLMSYPAKRRLSFVLDQTPYEAMLTVWNSNGEIVPLR